MRNAVRNVEKQKVSPSSEKTPTVAMDTAVIARSAVANTIKATTAIHSQITLPMLGSTIGHMDTSTVDGTISIGPSTPRQLSFGMRKTPQQKKLTG